MSEPNQRKTMCKCFTPSGCFGGGFSTLCRMTEQLAGDEDESLFMWARRVSLGTLRTDDEDYD